MAKLTTKDQRLVREHIHAYVQAGGEGDITIADYQRAIRWSEGYSMNEIGEEEHVTAQTVSRSVNKVVDGINKWKEAHDDPA